MEELLAVAQKTMENFNPATDSVSEFESLKDGVYNCLLEKVTSRVSQSGTPYISLDFSVMDENVNSHIFVPYYFSEKSAQFSIKNVSKLAYQFGFELSIDSFSSMETLAETLNGMAGLQAVVEQNTKTTKDGREMPAYKVTPMV